MITQAPLGGSTIYPLKRIVLKPVQAAGSDFLLTTHVQVPIFCCSYVDCGVALLLVLGCGLWLG